jgi:hypothetical protein
MVENVGRPIFPRLRNSGANQKKVLRKPCSTHVVQVIKEAQPRQPIRSPRRPITICTRMNKDMHVTFQEPAVRAACGVSHHPSLTGTNPPETTANQVLLLSAMAGAPMRVQGEGDLARGSARNPRLASHSRQTDRVCSWESSGISN